MLTQSPHAITCKPPCVSVFRPSRKVTAPDGTEWELYVSRFALPPWRPARYTRPDPITSAPFELVLFLLSIPVFLVEQVAWPLLRFVLELPGAAARAAHTDGHGRGDLLLAAEGQPRLDDVRRAR